MEEDKREKETKKKGSLKQIFRRKDKEREKDRKSSEFEKTSDQNEKSGLISSGQDNLNQGDNPVSTTSKESAAESIQAAVPNEPTESKGDEDKQSNDLETSNSIDNTEDKKSTQYQNCSTSGIKKNQGKEVKNTDDRNDSVNVDHRRQEDGKQQENETTSNLTKGTEVKSKSPTDVQVSSESTTAYEKPAEVAESEENEGNRSGGDLKSDKTGGGSHEELKSVRADHITSESAAETFTDDTEGRESTEDQKEFLSSSTSGVKENPGQQEGENTEGRNGSNILGDNKTPDRRDDKPTSITEKSPGEIVENQKTKSRPPIEGPSGSPGDNNKSKVQGSEEDSHTRKPIAGDKLVEQNKSSADRVISSYRAAYHNDRWIFIMSTFLSTFGSFLTGAIITGFLAGQYYDVSNRSAVENTHVPTGSIGVCPPGKPSDNLLLKGLEETKEDLQRCMANVRVLDKTLADTRQEFFENQTKCMANVTVLRQALSDTRQEFFKNQTKIVSEVVGKQYFSDAVMEQLKTSVMDKGVWAVPIIIMGLLEIVLFYLVCRRAVRNDSGPVTLSNDVNQIAMIRPYQLGQATSNTRYTPDNIQGCRKILSSIQPGGSLSMGICVVSFHTDAMKRHMNLVEQIVKSNTKLNNIPTIPCFIQNHADITQMSKSRVFLVFVDFNERNVILEDPSKGLGDLRLTTVQAAGKMGADVFVIYFGDEGSKQMSATALYNPNLTSIEAHSEMKSLSKNQRMLSVFRDFSQYQRQHIANCLTKDLVAA